MVLVGWEEADGLIDNVDGSTDDPLRAICDECQRWGVNISQRGAAGDIPKQLMVMQRRLKEGIRKSGFL